jgi:hypothetical protein
MAYTNKKMLPVGWSKTAPLERQDLFLILMQKKRFLVKMGCLVSKY